MLVLLPPSEGKSTPRRGPTLDLGALTAPALTGARRTVIDSLVDLCASDPDKAAEALGLGPTQAEEITRNQSLWEAPTAPAAKVYTGVLYSALDADTITGSAKRRLHRWVLVQSALFGLVRLNDRIPAYRLSADSTLPGVGAVGRFWRRAMSETLPEVAGPGLVVDLRSAAYAGFWKGHQRTVTVRVLQEVAGRRQVVSHFNKATKGRLVRALVEDGARPGHAPELAEHLAGLGWHVELQGPRTLAVIVTAL